ncbi:MAG: glutathione peroxidase [Planctomycetales bacterium]|nr:glutathione peroxidase [Planctomycetales bacterium]
MKSCLRLLVAISVVSIATSAFAERKESSVPAALAFKMKTLSGKEINLADYQGQVVLIVNVASKCGLTPQYEPLQALHEKYADQGLAVLGFPCNQFGKQEPGSADEIREFCSTNYGVKFKLFSKVDVNGPEACELYKHLTALETEPQGPGKISWNFEKFLIGRNGEVVARFSPRTRPDDAAVIAAIEKELAQK